MADNQLNQLATANTSALPQVHAEDVPRRPKKNDEILEPGMQVGGRFTIDRFLAEGGMGRVYVATQQPLGRTVALKVMKRELLADESSHKRFLREAVSVSKLDHPNTIRVFDFGELENGSVYMAMEFIVGEILNEVIKDEGAMAISRVVAITAQVLDSLAEAHSKKIVHRDLKPDNIFLAEIGGRSDFVKVLDFGIAKVVEGDRETKITMQGHVCGTPEYMSPEQARAEEVDGRSDIYSLGIMMYEMLTGRLPFNASSPIGTILKHQNEAPPPLPEDIPGPLRHYVMRLLNKDATQRPESARAAKDELDDLADELEAMGIELNKRSSGIMPKATRTQVSPPTTSPAMTETLQMDTGDIALDGASDKKSPLIPILIGVVILGILATGAVFMAASSTSGNTSDEPADDPAVAGNEEQVEPETQQEPALPDVVPVAIDLISTPAGAEVYANNRYVGRTPTVYDFTPAEAATISFRLDGYEEFVIEHTLPEGATEGEPLSATMVASTATVSFVSTPEGAAVSLEGSDETICTTPCESNFTVSRDPRVFNFTLDSHEDASAQRTISSTEPISVEVELEPVRAAPTNSGSSRPREPEPDDDNPFRVIDNR